MKTREEVMWAAGLFEGEGCFTFYRGTRFTPVPQAIMSMTDEDSVRRFAAAIGVGSVSGPYVRNHKPVWKWQTGGFPSTQAVVAMLWDGLGIRRKARAAEVLAASIGSRTSQKGRNKRSRGSSSGG